MNGFTWIALVTLAIWVLVIGLLLVLFRGVVANAETLVDVTDDDDLDEPHRADDFDRLTGAPW